MRVWQPRSNFYPQLFVQALLQQINNALANKACHQGIAAMLIKFAEVYDIYWRLAVLERTIDLLQAQFELGNVYGPTGTAGE